MRLGLRIIPLFVPVGIPAHSTSEEALFQPEAGTRRLDGLTAGIALKRAAILSSGGIVKPEREERNRPRRELTQTRDKVDKVNP